ncbi:nucleoside transporter 2, putative [Plasmodium malariae]|uniref:Nucleoside transporter 2, putative n=1 Tax=Plasmodium malariae TaxID=5858 RepID=A0A1C3KLK7_PLAMA|nr:nucleoside transporter 2, putative [Plasmodium malariae]
MGKSKNEATPTGESERHKEGGISVEIVDNKGTNEKLAKINECSSTSCSSSSSSIIIFANITICLMGMSSVLLYNCVLNTTPHIHALLNKDIIVSSTFFLYFSVLVFVSLISSLFIDVKTRTYDICFVLSFMLQLAYPFVVKFYYDKTLFFYILIGFIGATCSMMKTMIFSIASIVLNSSKVICLSYGLTGIYSLLITSTFFYFIFKIDKDINKLMFSIFVTCIINCIFILISFICYTIMKQTHYFKKKFKIYEDEREEKRRTSGSFYNETVSENKTTNVEEEQMVDASYSLNIGNNMQEEGQAGANTIVPSSLGERSGKIGKMGENGKMDGSENVEIDRRKDLLEDSLYSNNNCIDRGSSKVKEEQFTLHQQGKFKDAAIKSMEKEKEKGKMISPFEVACTQKNYFLCKFFPFNMSRENIMKQARIKAFLYKKSLIFLFCTFYNIFLKIAVFPVVCPEMWTKNVDERYILIGMVQIADCVSRIFPTFSETIPIFKFTLLPQKKVLLYSLLRTILSILCLIIPIANIALLQNFVFKCLLIFSNIYLNGWFVTLSFINISDVLKPYNSMSNVAIVSSFGSTLLRVGLLTGYATSTIYKYVVTRL